jgi:hypothetical protein
MSDILIFGGSAPFQWTIRISRISNPGPDPLCKLQLRCNAVAAVKVEQDNDNVELLCPDRRDQGPKH